jgi:hypothetical protein
MTQAVADYKGLTAVRPALLAWLALQCGPASAGRPRHPRGARRDD